MSPANDDPAPPADPGTQPGSRPRRRTSMGQSIGGVLFGFEQQVWRSQPPPHELVHHARPDAPVPAGDGGFLAIELPDDLAVASGDAGPPPGPEVAWRDEDEARREDDSAQDGRPQVDGIDIADRHVDADRAPEPDGPG